MNEEFRYEELEFCDGEKTAEMSQGVKLKDLLTYSFHEFCQAPK